MGIFDLFWSHWFPKRKPPWQMDRERTFLRRCAENDTESQRLFSVWSYRKLVMKTVHELVDLRELRMAPDIEAHLISRVIVDVYLNFKTIPGRKEPLRSSIRKFAIARTIQYLDIFGTGQP